VTMTTDEALLDLLEVINRASMHEIIPAGYVCRAWDALALEYPTRLQSYLRSRGLAPDPQPGAGAAP
jgi:hypothetical protein